MRYLISSTSLPSFLRLKPHIDDLGMLLFPAGWRTPYCNYACDNGVYVAWTRGKAWGEGMHRDYMGMLDKIPQELPPDWVLLPDAVANWPRTMELAQLYLPYLRERNLPVAIALQDGCDFAQALDFAPDWVFVAGSTEWKIANIGAACRFFHPLGVRVHVGRINTMQRMRLAQAAGVDSVDGTTLNKFPAGNLHRIKGSLQQPCLLLDAAEGHIGLSARRLYAPNRKSFR
jgi:hypothetical protein